MRPRLLGNGEFLAGSRIPPASVIVVLMLFGTGCQEQRGESLWRWVGPGLYVTVQHNEYLVHFTLADPGASHEAAMAIANALSRRDDDALSSEYFAAVQFSPPLRDRDLWALVLAKVAKRELRIYTSDDVDSRERKISRLVQSVSALERQSRQAAPAARNPPPQHENGPDTQGCPAL